MTTAELLADLGRLGIELVAHGDKLRYRPRSAMTPDLAERLKTHKSALLAVLRPAEGPARADPLPGGDDPQLVERQPDVAAPALGPDGWPEDSVEPGDPCASCGSLLFWWNPLGDRRCMACDGPSTAIRLLERVEGIRRRHGIPSPPGAVEMLADLKRLTDT